MAEAAGVVDVIYSSPARRCTETVEPIAAQSGIAIQLDDDLRESSFVDELSSIRLREPDVDACDRSAHPDGSETDEGRSPVEVLASLLGDGVVVGGL